jgi:DNA-binding winged helix-turn-helix (wHTH) protein
MLVHRDDPGSFDFAWIFLDCYNAGSRGPNLYDHTMQGPLAFGDFVLNAETRQLTHRGVALHLTRKAFDLLALLASQRPAAVSKGDICAALWADTFVSDTNLATLVFELRAALGESARHQRFLRTVHGFGYAFDAPAPPLPTAVGCRLVLAGEPIELTAGEHLIGRSRSCAIRCRSTSVSRIHARLTVAGSIATLEDLRSRNGTFVHGQRLVGPTILADGDEVIFGSEAASFETAGSTVLTEMADT